MFDRLDELADEYAALERDLADPAVHADPDRARTIGRRYGELGPVVHAYREWQHVRADEATARELAVPTADRPGAVRVGVHGRIGEIPFQGRVLIRQLIEPVKHNSLQGRYGPPADRS